MNKTIENLFYLMGILSTLNALMITVGGMQLAMVNFIIILTLILQVCYLKGKIYFYSYKINIYLLFFVFLVSSIGSYYYLPYMWFSDSFKATIKFLFLLFPFVFLFSEKDITTYRTKFLKGLLISAWIQLIWEFLQLILYYQFSISLNEIIFGNLFHIEINHRWSFIKDGQFRPSGVSWEPANLSLSLLMGFILANGLMGKILFSLGIILSTSRTGIIVWLFCLSLYIVIYLRKNAGKKNSQNVKWSNILTIYVTVFLMSIIILYLFMATNIVEVLNHTFERIISGIANDDSSANQHSNYYWQGINIISSSSIFQMFFGYGTTVAGYPFMESYNIFTWLEYPWTPESDFVTLLVGNGIIGFIIYYLILYKNLMLNRNNLKYWLMILVIIISGIMYVYIRSSWTLLIILLLYNKSINRGKEEKIST
ncbi:O-antigen ligase family protein [Bacillus sp. MB2021]|uniref:O-antigen ligase family protein n=1 Tax=Bacillus sp. MB2021 TaxID=1408303 RepID=UPI0004E1A383|nr:O-antigen ligase family protein [Bacillus sp. MB2021]